MAELLVGLLVAGLAGAFVFHKATEDNHDSDSDADATPPPPRNNSSSSGGGSGSGSGSGSSGSSSGRKSGSSAPLASKALSAVSRKASGMLSTLAKKAMGTYEPPDNNDDELQGVAAIAGQFVRRDPTRGTYGVFQYLTVDGTIADPKVPGVYPDKEFPIILLDGNDEDERGWYVMTYQAFQNFLATGKQDDPRWYASASVKCSVHATTDEELLAAALAFKDEGLKTMLPAMSKIGQGLARAGSGVAGGVQRIKSWRDERRANTAAAATTTATAPRTSSANPYRGGAGQRAATMPQPLAEVDDDDSAPWGALPSSDPDAMFFGQPSSTTRQQPPQTTTSRPAASARPASQAGGTPRASQAAAASTRPAWSGGVAASAAGPSAGGAPTPPPWSRQQPPISGATSAWPPRLQRIPDPEEASGAAPAADAAAAVPLRTSWSTAAATATADEPIGPLYDPPSGVGVTLPSADVAAQTARQGTYSFSGFTPAFGVPPPTATPAAPTTPVTASTPMTTAGTTSATAAGSAQPMSLNECVAHVTTWAAKLLDTCRCTGTCADSWSNSTPSCGVAAAAKDVQCPVIANGTIVFYAPTSGGLFNGSSLYRTCNPTSENAVRNGLPTQSVFNLDAPDVSSACAPYMALANYDKSIALNMALYSTWMKTQNRLDPCYNTLNQFGS